MQQPTVQAQQSPSKTLTTPRSLKTWRTPQLTRLALDETQGANAPAAPETHNFKSSAS